MKRLFAAGAAGASLLSSVSGAQAATAPVADVPDEEERHCVVELDSGQQMTCYDSAIEAQARTARTALAWMVLATHYEHHNATGSSIVIKGSSCSGSWIPSEWWATRISSTTVSGACAGAKHYTLSSCAGSAQITGGWVTNLNAQLNDNTRCVRYA